MNSSPRERHGLFQAYLQKTGCSKENNQHFMTHCNRTRLKPLQASLGMSSRISARLGPTLARLLIHSFFAKSFLPKLARRTCPSLTRKNVQPNSGAFSVIGPHQWKHVGSLSRLVPDRNYGLWSERLH